MDCYITYRVIFLLLFFNYIISLGCGLGFSLGLLVGFGLVLQLCVLLWVKKVSGVGKFGLWLG